MKNSGEEKEDMGQNSERPAGIEGTENERLKSDLSREHELYLRTLADFDNYRRRVVRERAVSAKEGIRELVLPLLDVLADFDRALEHLDDVPEWMSSGFVAIYKRLSSILQAQGIVSYVSIGETFDPLLHEAVGLTDSHDVEPGTIVAELSRGYRWGDEVFRPARVRVAQ
jgi:molecular chaperone GrpE